MGNSGMKPSEITSLHTALEEEIKRILDFSKLKIKQPQGDGDWSKASVGSRVVFELLYHRTYEGQTAERDRGGKCSIFALGPDYPGNSLSSLYWVSWFEQWQVEVPRQNLHLRTASWSVFAGPPNREKRQIIRAEWDQLPIAGSKRSGQPHWHVDRFPRLEAGTYGTTAVALPAEASLVLANAVDGASQLTGLHLAMGAWDAKLKHPECWQRLARKTDDLLTWGVRTLEYLKSELPCQS